MKIKGILKKQTIIVAASIVLIAIALLGVSYAIFFDVKANEKNQIVSTGTLKLVINGIDENETIDLNNAITTEEAKNLEPISYTISNVDSSLPATYKIYIHADSANEISHDYVYLSFSDSREEFGEPKVLSSLIEEDGSYIDENEISYYRIDSGDLVAEDICTTKYLWIWIDEELINQDLVDVNAKFNLYIVSEVAENMLAKEYILNHSEMGVGDPDFSKTSCSSGCEETTVGLYSVPTSLGTTYYYRGNVEDNYVEFAGFYWRIVRINENGSLRLIYSGVKEDIDLAGREIILANGNSNGFYTLIDKGVFNETPTKDLAKMGFMYTDSAGIYNGNNESSDIKKQLDLWFEQNLKKYIMHMDRESGFCGDRTYIVEEPEASSWYAPRYYGANLRIYTDNPDITQIYENGPEPSYDCPDTTNDLYTLNGVYNVGNRKLKYPIGLLTADEISYAGGKYGETNNSYYLYIGEWYWTISPSKYEPFYGDYNEEKGQPRVFITNGYISDSEPTATSGIRPVINLNTNNLNISGNGLINDPYVFS